MTSIIGPLNSGAAVGAAGVATAHLASTVRIPGLLLGICVKYNDAPPAATTDVVISTVGTSPAPPTRALLTLTNGATDGWRYPRVAAHSVLGVENAGDLVYQPIEDYVDIKIDGANAGDNVDVWLLVE